MQKQQHESNGENPFSAKRRDGKLRYGVAAWLLGLPLPIIIIALFIRGCDW